MINFPICLHSLLGRLNLYSILFATSVLCIHEKSNALICFDCENPLPILNVAMPSNQPEVGFLIVPMSGEVDADGNTLFQHRNFIYRQLTSSLSERGYLAASYAKRDIPPLETLDTPLIPVMQLYAIDAYELANELIRRHHLRCVWLIGHSEGGVVALMAANRVSSLCGIILIASPRNKISEVLIDQFNRLPFSENEKKEAIDILNDISNEKNIDYSKISQNLQIFFNKNNHYKIKDQINIDPTNLMEEIYAPIFYIVGQNDIQVPISYRENRKFFQKIRCNFVIESMNHYLIEIDSNKDENDRKKISHGLIETIKEIAIDSCDVVDNW